MHTPKFLFVLGIGLFGAANAQADAPVPAPPGIPVTSPGTINSGVAPTSCEPAALNNYFLNPETGIRRAMREELAKKIAVNMKKMGMISPVRDVECIDSRENYFSDYVKGEDTFMLTCLGQYKGEFTHMIQVKYKAEPPCLSRDAFTTWIGSGSLCKKPGGMKEFIDSRRACLLDFANAAAAGRPPVGLGNPSAYNVTEDYYAQLLQAKPTVANVVTEDRKVKGALSNGGRPSHSSGTSSTGAPCRGPYCDGPPPVSGEVR